ncbi:MAG: VCBS repeat-containing protein [Armatimonadetes bacterium]|nr:VCBS repeat-containing protein [Armatimonadota bacterium]
MLSQAGYSVFLAALVALVVSAVQAADLPPPPTEKTYHLTVALVRDGQPACAIVPPPGDDWAALAAQVQAALKPSGAMVPIVAAKDVTPEDLRTRNLILLGNFANNPAVVPIYHQHFIMSDDVWPGPGGYELRTIHDPLGAGTSFLYVGGSDLAGVAAGVQALRELLPAGRTVELPATIKILSEGRSPTPGDLAKVPELVQRLRGLQFREVASRICSAGLTYHATGDLAQAEFFKQALPVLAEIVGKMPAVTDARGSVLLPLIWDLVEEAPVFMPAERAAAFRFMWEYANKCPDANKQHTPGVKPQGNNWDARANWAAACYFHKYYNLDVAGLWTWCDTYFGKDGQARFWKTSEDCPGYGSITYHDLLFYALNKPDWTWFENGNLRRAADYGLTIINNLGAMSGFGDTSDMSGAYHWPALLLNAAWYTRDGRYRYLYDLLPEKGQSPSEYLYTNYRDNSVKPVEPVDMLGIKAMPLDRWIHEHPREALSSGTPADKFLDAQTVVPPYEKCFDKISFRNGFKPEQQYLLLGGISHGYHSHPDGNAIIGYTDHGRYMLFDNGYFVPDTIEHNTLAIYRDGLFEPVPRFTTLEQRVDLGPMGLCQTMVSGYNGTDWRRNIFWARDKWFVCLDEVEARTAGDYGLTCVWRTMGDLALKTDRVCATQPGARFSLLNADGARFRVTGTTPPSRERKALMQSRSAALAAGQKTCFMNLFYSPGAEADFPYEIVQAGPGAALVRESGEIICVGVNSAGAGLPQVKAALFAVGSRSFTLAGGTSLAWDTPWFASSKPVDIEADMGKGTAKLSATEAATVSLAAAPTGKFTLDGKEIKPRRQGAVALFEVPAGTHELTFAPVTKPVQVPRLQGAWQRLAKEHAARVAALEAAAGKAEGLRKLWEADNALAVKQTVYHPAGTPADAAHALPDLARLGKPSFWTEGSRGSSPRAAMDGDPESYSAVGSGEPHATMAPKDLGVEWQNPQTVAQVRVAHYSMMYAPAADGTDVQTWDGKDWVSVQDTITGTDTPNWVHTFAPVQTTRVRLLITKFGGARPAIRSFAVFAQPVEAAEVTVRQPQATAALELADLSGIGQTQVVVVVGKTVRVLDAQGQPVWEAALPAECGDLDAYDLNHDGQREVVVGAGTNLYCFDAAGQKLWEAPCPKDKYLPEVEPAQGPFRVVKCDDLNGDGFGEIIAGSGNWFTYCFSHEGKALWGTLNWAHQPTSIATVDLAGDGKRAALVGNTYCSANLFGADGKVIGDVPVGYHGAAMTVAAGDMNGDGKAELIAGSRIGGIHCKTYGADAVAWSLDAGAEITATMLADINGDGRPELLVASRNGYVMALDSEGKALWRHNCGNPVRSLAVATGKDAVIAAATDVGAVVVLNTGGEQGAIYPIAADVVKVALGDLDGDGQPEIVAAAADGKLYALKLM